MIFWKNTRQELDLESISNSLATEKFALVLVRARTPTWPKLGFARNIDQKRDLVVPTLVINPFESYKDDLMYSIDERFVDGIIQGRVITWQAKFFNYSRAVPRGPGLNGPLKNEKLQQEYIIFGIFATCLFGSIFTFFKFFTLRGCFEGLRDCFKSKDGGYKGGFSDLWLVSL